MLSRKDCLKAIKTFHFDKSPNTLFYMLIEFKLPFPKENSKWSNSNKTLWAHQIVWRKCHWNGDVPTKSHNFEAITFFPHGEYSDWLYSAVCFCTLPAQLKGVCVEGQVPRHEGAEIHHVTEEIPAGDWDSSLCCWRLTHKTKLGLDVQHLFQAGWKD